MRRALILAALLVSTAAHAGWSDGPGNVDYDGGSALSNGAIGIVVALFAIYGWYKFATRND
jgi:hypothetical protein